MTGRIFQHTPAVRARVPLLVGLTGPSGGGKTKSALRLADGMRAVTGGDVYLIDTESNRGLHYANEHRYFHVPFVAPFGPSDYVAACQSCVDKGASVIIVDSCSHEWEGEGGVLSIQERELDRMCKGDQSRRAAMNMAAWVRAKREHGLFVRMLLQSPAHFILCFRAKNKLRIKRGEDPRERGFMAIAGSDLIYELALNALLLPGARGFPTWRPTEEGEQEQVKLPGWADGFFRNGEPIDEKAGERLAQWAAGTTAPTPQSLLASYDACSAAAELGTLETDRKALWKTLTKIDQSMLKEASDAAKERIRIASLPVPDLDAGEVPLDQEQVG